MFFSEITLYLAKHTEKYLNLFMFLVDIFYIVGSPEADIWSTKAYYVYQNPLNTMIGLITTQKSVRI